MGQFKGMGTNTWLQMAVSWAFCILTLIMLSAQYHSHPNPDNVLETALPSSGNFYWPTPSIWSPREPSLYHSMTSAAAFVVGYRGRLLVQARQKTCPRNLGIQTRGSKLRLAVLLDWENINLGTAVGGHVFNRADWQTGNWSAVKRRVQRSCREAQRSQTKYHGPDALGVPAFNLLLRVSCTPILEFWSTLISLYCNPSFFLN